MFSAAKDLFITQSTLSGQILNLEHELGQQLFDRNSHEVILTEAGQMLMPLARQTVNAANDCRQQLTDLKNIQAGELNIGVTFSFSSIAAETMMDFLKRYPRVKMNVSYASMAELMDKLMRHELDLVLAFKPIAAPGNTMEGCIHTLRNAYLKNSARTFISMLNQSVTVLHD